MTQTHRRTSLMSLAAGALCVLVVACDGGRNLGATLPDSQSQGGSAAGGSSAEESTSRENVAGASATTEDSTRDAGAAPASTASTGDGGGSGGSGGTTEQASTGGLGGTGGQGGEDGRGGVGSAGTEQGGGAGGASQDCRQDAACSGDDTCSVTAGDCFVDCTCAAEGTFDCELDCPAPYDCSEGAACTPGSTCGAEMNSSCWVSCLCREDGTFRCDESCGSEGPGGTLLCDAPPGRECDAGIGGGCGASGNGCASSCSCDAATEQIQCSFSCQNESCPPSPPPAGFLCQPPSVASYPVGATCPYPDLEVTCTCDPFGTTERVYWECVPD